MPFGKSITRWVSSPKPFEREKRTVLETEEAYEFDIAKFIKATARRQSSGVMDAEDLEQDLWVFYLEQVEPRGYHDGAVVDILKKQASKIDKEERIDYMYFRGSFIYTPSMVRTLLADAVWCDVQDAFDIEGRVDVTRALQELPYATQRLLYARFMLGDKPERKSANEKTIERAVDSIAATLNFRSGAEQVDETFVIDPQSLGGASF